MEELSSGSSDYAANTWIAWFLSTKGNEYFCEVDEEYILDRFNLTGLNAEVQHYPQALDVLTDALGTWHAHAARLTDAEDNLDDDAREQIETQARLLYGLIHARFIITTRGLAKMLEKYKRADFGRCPRVLCYQQPLLPIGLSDVPFQKPVKLYCPRCEDLYSPKSSRHGSIDGAFFGSTFPHMLFMVYPHLLPSKTAGSPYAPTPSMAGQTFGGLTAEALHQRAQMVENNIAAASRAVPQEPGENDIITAAEHGAPGSGAIASPTGTASTLHGDYGAAHGAGGAGQSGPCPVERVRPRIFGFPVHETSRLMAWQERQQKRQVERLQRFQHRSDVDSAPTATAAPAAPAAPAPPAAGPEASMSPPPHAEEVPTTVL